MDESFLYRRIAETIRADILNGRLQPGDRLPSIRQLTEQWHCTPGTVQRAYQELAQLGLVVSQAGKGTHVTHQIDLGLAPLQAPLRQAGLVNRAESFLLEVLTAGHDLNEIQQAFTMAMDRWRAFQTPKRSENVNTIRFSGSHDMVLIALAGRLDEIAPGVNLQLSFTGSLGGLMALASGAADLAGTHLYDAQTGQYNLPFIARLFPGRRMRVTRLANRRVGLIVPAGNPLKVKGLRDLVGSTIQFVNRQAGSGTRVWFDTAIEGSGIRPEQINGYQDEKATHSEVARTIAEGNANAGIGLESAAMAFHLDFIFLIEEPYDLVSYACEGVNSPIDRLLAWVAGPEGKQAIGRLAGYDAREAGREILV